MCSGLFADGDVSLWDMKNYLRAALTNTGENEICISFYLVIRSFRAAGGPIRRMAFRDNKVFIDDTPLIYPDAPPSRFRALSYAEIGQDISEYLTLERCACGPAGG